MTAARDRTSYDRPQSRAGRAFKLTPPVPSERDFHESVAQMLNRIVQTPAMWFSYPAGASVLSPQQQARHSRIGVRRGLPDLWFLFKDVYCIELKTNSGRLSKTRVGRTRSGAPRIYLGQEDVFPQLIETGAVKEIIVCVNLAQVVACLDRWQIPHRAVKSIDVLDGK